MDILRKLRAPQTIAESLNRKITTPNGKKDLICGSGVGKNPSVSAIRPRIVRNPTRLRKKKPRKKQPILRKKGFLGPRQGRRGGPGSFSGHQGGRCARRNRDRQARLWGKWGKSDGCLMGRVERNYLS